MKYLEAHSFSCLHYGVVVLLSVIASNSMKGVCIHIYDMIIIEVVKNDRKNRVAWCL